jgi:hypothetical protein
MAGFETSLDFNFSSGAILEFGFLPGWIEGFIAAIAIGVIGIYVLRKIEAPLNDLIDDLNLPSQLGEAFTKFFVTIMTFYVLGRALEKLPSFTDPEIIPANSVGNVITSLVGFSFQLLVPVALIFVGFYLHSERE